jgi:hypothetical protein
MALVPLVMVTARVTVRMRLRGRRVGGMGRLESAGEEAAQLRGRGSSCR